MSTTVSVSDKGFTVELVLDERLRGYLGTLSDENAEAIVNGLERLAKLLVCILNYAVQASDSTAIMYLIELGVEAILKDLVSVIEPATTD